MTLSISRNAPKKGDTVVVLNIYACGNPVVFIDPFGLQSETSRHNPILIPDEPLVNWELVDKILEECASDPECAAALNLDDDSPRDYSCADCGGTVDVDDDGTTDIVLVPVLGSGSSKKEKASDSPVMYVIMPAPSGVPLFGREHSSSASFSSGTVIRRTEEVVSNSTTRVESDPLYRRILYLSLLNMYDPDKIVPNLPLVGQGMVETGGGILAITGGVQSGEYKAAAVGVHFTLMGVTNTLVGLLGGGTEFSPALDIFQPGIPGSLADRMFGTAAYMNYVQKSKAYGRQIQQELKKK